MGAAPRPGACVTSPASQTNRKSSPTQRTFRSPLRPSQVPAATPWQDVPAKATSRRLGRLHLAPDLPYDHALHAPWSCRRPTEKDAACDSLIPAAGRVRECELSNTIHVTELSSELGCFWTLACRCLGPRARPYRRMTTPMPHPVLAPCTVLHVRDPRVPKGVQYRLSDETDTLGLATGSGRGVNTFT